VWLALVQVVDGGAHLALVDQPAVVEQVVGERQVGRVGELARQGRLSGRQTGVESVGALALIRCPAASSRSFWTYSRSTVSVGSAGSGPSVPADCG
jgi:hypothetical protein